MGVKVREKPKGSGIWYIFITHNKKRKAKQIGPKKAAHEAAKIARAKIALGDLGFLEEEEKEQEKTFGHYAKIALKLARIRDSTRKDYKRDLKKHVLPTLSKRPISEITRLEIKTLLVSKLDKDYSVSSVNSFRAVISLTFNVALDDKAITENPALKLGKLEGKRKSIKTKKKKKIIFLDKKQIKTLLDKILEEAPDEYPYTLLLARTGLRTGEAVALKWTDIDFKKREIHVQRAISKGKLELTKSGEDRKVDMSHQLTATLKSLSVKKKEEALAKGKKVSEWIFPSPRWPDRPRDPHAWRRKKFNPILEKTDIPQIRIHDLRHSYASMLIKNGESLVHVRDQLGHHSIQVTADYYGHLVPGENKAAVDALDDADFVVK